MSLSVRREMQEHPDLVTFLLLIWCRRDRRRMIIRWMNFTFSLLSFPFLLLSLLWIWEQPLTNNVWERYTMFLFCITAHALVFNYTNTVWGRKNQFNIQAAANTSTRNEFHG